MDKVATMRISCKPKCKW